MTLPTHLEQHGGVDISERHLVEAREGKKVLGRHAHDTELGRAASNLEVVVLATRA